MAGWRTHTGNLVHLPLNNIDTDQIIPARFMSQPRADGYADFLFYDLRRDDAGNIKYEFPLQQGMSASILLAGENFGTGSSREAAAYALVDAGIKVVLARSFGDIFAANAVNNGLLPAVISAAQHTKISAAAATDYSLICTVDLQCRQVSFRQHSIDFTIDKTWCTKLINGWDDIDLTLKYTSVISAYGKQRQQKHSWAWPKKT